MHDIRPRLTGSTSLEQSQRWARDLFESYGLSNAHLHKWGEVETRFDRGPSTGKIMMQSSRRRNSEPSVVRELEFTRSHGRRARTARNPVT